jgi:fluoroacetyl-CoA thioesterase
MDAVCSAVEVEPGLRGEARLVVAAADTAEALGSGSVAVLGTPRLIALCEAASIAAIAARLPAGMTTVGMRVQMEHLQPSAIGAQVTAEAVLDKVEGRRLCFTVSASDERGLIACGKVTRVQVDLDRFLDKARCPGQ